MHEAQTSDAGAIILFDRDRLAEARSELFEPAFWQNRNALLGSAPGRGTTYFVRHGSQEWALRHYLRGGMVAKLIRDGYLWHGLAQTRAWREWRVTAALRAKNLPVPAPIAARVIRNGLRYHCDLITERLRDVESFSSVLRERAPAPADWRRLGATLRRFHDAGVDHADLNAHNILVAADGGFYLIDFDKARLRADGDWKEGNLARLLRSLRKLQAASAQFHFDDADWDNLRKGYS